MYDQRETSSSHLVVSPSTEREWQALRYYSCVIESLLVAGTKQSLLTVDERRKTLACDLQYACIESRGENGPSRCSLLPILSFRTARRPCGGAASS